MVCALWSDIKGNVKWDVIKWGVLGLVVVALSSFSLLKNGFSPWLQVALAACFGVTLLWALAATLAAIHAMRHPDSAPQSAERPLLGVQSPTTSVLPVGWSIHEPYLKHTTICLNYRPNLYTSHYAKAFSDGGDVLYISVMSQNTLKKMRDHLDLCKAKGTRLRVLTWHQKIPEAVIEAYRQHLREEDKYPERFVTQTRQAAFDWQQLQTEYSRNLEVREYCSVATMQGVIVKDKWAMIELIPYATETNERPALLLAPSTDPELFALLVDRFEQLWADNRPNLINAG
jgi:hypothetical protein